MQDLLNREALKTLGLPDGFSFGLRDRVRFGELDALNHVNNAVYFKWTENLRVQIMPIYELSDFESGDRNFVIRAQSIEYFTPMFLFEEYILAGRFTRVGNSSLEMEYEVYVGERMSARITAQLVMMNADLTASKRVPDAARAKLLELDGVS
ncbi:MAG: thioesterase family protein [Pseudomonadota bacterium]